MARIQQVIDNAQVRTGDVKQLEKLVAEQAATIERLRRTAGVKAPKTKLRKGQKSYVRVLFGDVHGEHLDKPAVAAFLSDLEVLKPTSVVCIGDLLDCGGFLSQHKTLGVVAELDVTYEQDVAAGNMVLDEVQKRAPKASFDLIEGNHENRINRWICDQVLGSARNAEYLRRLVGTSAVLSLDKRGIRYVERHKYYDGLSISGTIKLEPHGVAQHGEAFCGKYAGYRHMERLGESVFFGHSHRLKSVYAEKLDGPIVAVNTGCLCQRRPLYGLTKTTDWMHGYVMQVCSSDGFLAIPIPIIDGVSYLQPLTKLLKV